MVATETRKFPLERFTDGMDDTPWAAEFAAAFDQQQDRRFFMLEWARRHRKTSNALTLLVRDCMKYKKWVSVYVAPYLVQAREIVWDDPKMLFSILPPEEDGSWKKNESKLMITFNNESILRLAGGDKLENRRGIDCNDLLLDEFSYAKETLWTKIFSPVMAGRSDVPRRTIFTYTPNGDNHAVQRFNWASNGEVPTSGVAQHCKPGWWVSRVTNSGTKFLDPAFLKQCKEQWPQSLFDQEIECARVTEEEKTLITSALLASLRTRDWGIDWVPHRKRIIACDPALGGDECAIYYIDNTEIKDELFLHDRDAGKVVTKLLVMAANHDCDNFVVDSIGNGQAIVALLEHQSSDKRPLNIIRFNSAEKALDERFGNRRSEAWWRLMQKCQALEVAYPADPECARQIPFASRYRLGGRGKIYIQDKDRIKEALGQSPDRAEAWMMGQWALPQVESDAELQTRYNEYHGYGRRGAAHAKPQSAMAC